MQSIKKIEPLRKTVTRNIESLSTERGRERVSVWSRVQMSVCVSALPVEHEGRGACGTPQTGSLAVGWAKWARWWPARLTLSSACWQTQSTNAAASGKACRKEITLVNAGCKNYRGWTEMKNNRSKAMTIYYFILSGFANHIIPPQKKLKNT